VRRAALRKAFHVVAHRVGVDLGLSHTLLEHVSFMDALTAGQDLLAALCQRWRLPGSQS
jgi:hypothetical protein